MNTFIIIYLLLSCIGIGLSFAKHGEEQKKVSPFETVIIWSIICMLLSFGKFFQNMNVYHYIYLGFLGVRLGLSMSLKTKKFNVIINIVSFGITIFLFYKAGLIK